MRKLTPKIVPIAACSLLAAAAGPALAAPQHAKGASTVRVVMRDPGCHWFAVGGAFKTKLAVKGPVALANFDEAALVIKGSHGVKRAGVGAKVTLTRGTYVIKMVKQPADDNTLRLTVR